MLKKMFLVFPVILLFMIFFASFVNADWSQPSCSYSVNISLNNTAPWRYDNETVFNITIDTSGAEWGFNPAHGFLMGGGYNLSWRNTSSFGSAVTGFEFFTLGFEHYQNKTDLIFYFGCDVSPDSEPDSRESLLFAYDYMETGEDDESNYTLTSMYWADSVAATSNRTTNGTGKGYYDIGWGPSTYGLTVASYNKRNVISKNGTGLFFKVHFNHSLQKIGGAASPNAYYCFWTGARGGTTGGLAGMNSLCNDGFGVGFLMGGSTEETNYTNVTYFDSVYWDNKVFNFSIFQGEFAGDASSHKTYFWEVQKVTGIMHPPYYCALGVESSPLVLTPTVNGLSGLSTTVYAGANLTVQIKLNHSQPFSRNYTISDDFNSTVFDAYYNPSKVDLLTSVDFVNLSLVVNSSVFNVGNYSGNISFSMVGSQEVFNFSYAIVVSQLSAEISISNNTDWIQVMNTGQSVSRQVNISNTGNHNCTNIIFTIRKEGGFGDLNSYLSYDTAGLVVDNSSSLEVTVNITNPPAGVYTSENLGITCIGDDEYNTVTSINSIDMTFVVITPSTSSPVVGGGGGDEEEDLGLVCGEGGVSWIATTSVGTSALELFVAPGVTRRTVLTIVNNGTEPVNIFLECVENEGVGVCDWVNITKKVISTVPQEQKTYLVDVIVDVPANAVFPDSGDYKDKLFFGVLVIDDKSNCRGVISYTLINSYFGGFLKRVGGIPILLLSIPVSIIAFAASLILFRKVPVVNVFFPLILAVGVILLAPLIL